MIQNVTEGWDWPHNIKSYKNSICGLVVWRLGILIFFNLGFVSFICWGDSKNDAGGIWTHAPESGNHSMNMFHVNDTP